MASTSDLGTVRAAGSLGSSLETMIEHNSCKTVESQLGTMVINSEDEEENADTMKRE